MDAIYYDESEYGETPRCPFSRRHHLSAEPGGYYCYECAEHYGNPPSLTGRNGERDPRRGEENGNEGTTNC